MIVYRHNNPHRNSKKATGHDEEVPITQFFKGRIVWVGPAGERQKYICTGKPGEAIPLGEYRELKAARRNGGGSTASAARGRRKRTEDLRQSGSHAV
jgi:hypothetical protein